ncbi:MAG: hypothetical protein ACJARG_000053 [Arcticibacterium sp.]|jgi:hypothetical protein
MKRVFLAYECDVWHTHQSKVLIGAFITKGNAIKGITERAAETEDELDEDDFRNLEDMNQTQSFQGSIREFMIEEIEANKLI